MELSKKQQKILEPFVDATVMCLETMAGLKAVPGKGSCDDVERFWLNDYIFVVDTHGEVEGRIVMHYFMESTLDIGNKIRAGMLGSDCEEATEVDEEILEALAEFSNTVVGRAMKKLESQQMLVSFKPPRYISDIEKADFLKFGVQDVLSMPVDVEGIGQFHVNYLIQDITEL